MKGKNGERGSSASGPLDEILETMLGNAFVRHKRLIRFAVALFVLLLLIAIVLASIGM